VQRLSINPALRRLWRRDGSLQLGLEPPHAVVVEGIDGSAALLENGITPQAMATLAAAGVLRRHRPTSEPVPAQLEPDVLARSLTAPDGDGERVLLERRRRGVWIHGAGRVGATLAGLLSAAGVGRIGCIDRDPARPADVSPGGLRDCRAVDRGRAAGEVARHACPWPAMPAGRAPDLSVLAPVGAMSRPEVGVAVSGGPHVEVVIRETLARIGPLVVPGRTPCRRCAELRRADRDPHWPWLAAQLAGSSRRVEPADLGLAVAAASLTALHVLRWLDDTGVGRTDPVRHPLIGGVVELSLVDLRLRRRRLEAHPECGCGAASPQ
jgi:bacteriocin biosynthesis cyclodehydratase domain-containing protein